MGVKGDYGEVCPLPPTPSPERGERDQETASREEVLELLRDWMLSPDQIELLVMNAGEGAFHWVQCHHCAECEGWLYDCGTRSGARKLNRSIEWVKNSADRAPALLVVSHYHSDHISHLRQLGEALGIERHPKEIWVPGIEPHSIMRYLRILAMGTLFRSHRTLLDDRELTELFARKEHLVGDLRKWYPESGIKQVYEGERSVCPTGKAGIEVLILTPPRWPAGDRHPLNEAVSWVRTLATDKKLGVQIENAANTIMSTARDSSGFSEFLDREFDSTARELLPGFGEQLRKVFESAPEPEWYDRQSNLLRLMLAASAFAPDPAKGRVNLSSGKPSVASRHKRTLRDWPRTTRGATHLFNVAARFRDEASSTFLLTGDADVRLWQKILNNGGPAYDAIQIPHHGSEENVVWEAYEKLDCDTFLVSAHSYKSWRHPSRQVGTAINQGASGQLYCTNEHRNCEMHQGGPCLPFELTALSKSQKGVMWISEKPSKKATPCSRF